jgi:Rv0078B-related antitoxin
VDPGLDAAARRLRLALDLFEAGEELMRQQLRRKHPALTTAEIEARLLTWLLERPGAEFGDTTGRLVPWPRPSR